jgi:integrase
MNFESWILSDIKPGTVQGFLSEKTQSGVGWNTLRNVRNLLSSILRTAVDWQYLEENPAAKAKLPPKPLKRSARHLLPDQVRKLIAEIPEPYRLIVIVALLTGLRRSELFALRWGALDLEKGVLEVRESVYNGHFSTTKTRSSSRRVPLSSTVLKLLRDRRANLVSARDEDLVFPSRNGSAFRPDNLLRRIIHPACDRLRIRRVGWHAFRHTHATQLSELGENPKTAQAILEHSDLETTMQAYTHAVPDTMVRAEERLAQLLLDLSGPKSETAATQQTEEDVWIQYERPETQVTHCTGHIGDTFSL